MIKIDKLFNEQSLHLKRIWQNKLIYKHEISINTAFYKNTKGI